MKKRVVSLLLCLIMALSLIPTVAFAAEPAAEGQQSVEQLDTLAGDPQATSLLTRALGWKYAKIEQPSAGGITITQPSTDEDLSNKVTVTIEQPLGGTENMKQNTSYDTSFHLPHKKVHITSADPNYYIAYVAFCCSGPKNNSYNCTAPQLLLKGNESITSVSMSMWELSQKQSLLDHASYCWLMVMVKPIEETPTPDPTKGTLTITKNIKGLPFDQVPVKTFDYTVNLYPNYEAADPIFEFTVAQTATDITGTKSAQLDVARYSLTEGHLGSDDVAGYKHVTTFALDGTIVDTWDHSDPNDDPEWPDFNIAAGKTTNIVITDTYTPIGNDENNYATISIKKYETGNENKPLAGAKFKLEKLAGTNWVAYGSVGTTDANGALAYTVMDAGDYKLTEVEAPAGYKLSGKSEWTFTVVKSSSTKTVDNKIVNVYDYKITKVDKETIATEDQVRTHLFEIANTKIPTVAVAIQKVVKVTGNTAPGSVVFTFGAKYQDGNKNWVELACANNTITTNGAGTYTRNDMTITLPDTIPAGGLEIVIYEKNDGRANWTYSKDTYKLHVLAAGTIEAVPATNSTSATLPSVPVYSFENTYSYTYTPPARPSDPIRRQPTTTTTKPVKSVKTGDMGIALYAVTSLLSLSGTALLIKKRKDEK